MRDYLKAIGAAVATGLTAYYTAVDDSTVTNAEWIMIVVAIVGSSGAVWYVTNGPGGQYAKAIFAMITAAGASAILALQDNVLTQQETVAVAIAALGALGLVAVLPGPRKT